TGCSTRGSTADEHDASAGADLVRELIHEELGCADMHRPHRRTVGLVQSAQWRRVHESGGMNDRLQLGDRRKYPPKLGKVAEMHLKRSELVGTSLHQRTTHANNPPPVLDEPVDDGAADSGARAG